MYSCSCEYNVMPDRVMFKTIVTILFCDKFSETRLADVISHNCLSLYFTLLKTNTFGAK